MPQQITGRNDTDLIALARRQVETAIRGADDLRALAFGDGSSAARLTVALRKQERPDIPGYADLHEHRRGGQGIVYRAVQVATGREVAIKLLYAEALGAGADVRFAREVQVLARLKHPNVVTIHDSGIIAGRSYIIMDFVEGLPLDRWFQVHLLEAPDTTARVRRQSQRDGVRDALQLFGKICDAVQAAHVRGVIHRDLKPANILVDKAGEPHVLDFGLAKLMPDTSMDAGPAAMTHAGQFVGSVPWSSPEQIDGREDLDTRSDVYGLGVLLFQCLTGKFPYPVDGPMFATFRNIRELPPTRPGALRSEIDDELDTIVLRCLAKERERRYQTAGELGRDLASYLRGAPIDAKRDSVAYLARKALRRYRAPILAGGAFLVLLVAGMLTSTVLWRQAAIQRDRAAVAESEAVQERDRAVAAEADALEHRDRAVAAETVATQGRDQAEMVNELLQSLLVCADPTRNQGRTVTVPELLDRFERTKQPRFAEQPAVEAALRTTVAEAYRHLGEFEKARVQIEQAQAAAMRAHGPSHQRTLTALFSRAALHADLNELAQAAQLYEHILQTAAQQPDLEPELIIQAENRFAQVLERQTKYGQARAHLEHALQLAQEKLGPTHAVTASCIHSMGSLLFDLGRYEEAAEHHARSAEIYRAMDGEHDSDYGVSLHDCGIALLKLERFDEARQRFQEALTIHERAYGVGHLFTAGPLGALAMTEAQAGDLPSAEQKLRRVLEIQRAKLPRGHAEIAGTLNNLAANIQDQQRPDEAAALYIEAIEMFRVGFPQGHPLLSGALSNLGRMWYLSGRADRAEPLLREALALDERLLPPLHPARIENRKGLARILYRLGRYEEAMEHIRVTIANQTKAFGATDPRIAQNQLWLAEALAQCAAGAQECGPPASAEQHLLECLDIRRAQLPQGHWQVGSAELLLADALAQQSRAEEAEEHLLAGWSLLRADPATPPARMPVARAQIKCFYDQIGEPERAAELLAPVPDAE